jgi:pyrimidine operon attenuation protein/uracil phosphoribosyltransferase
MMTPSTPTVLPETLIFSAQDIERTLKRLAHEVLESNQGGKNLVLLGIVTRGRYMAQRLAALMESFEGASVPWGAMDVTLYRDDADQTFKPAFQSEVPVDITGRTVVLVDDVIYSGRTIRAALDAMNDYGRPASVQLLVLLDRGHRELPIHADYVGKNLPTSKSERVNVRLQDVDGIEQVTLSKS